MAKAASDRLSPTEVWAGLRGDWLVGLGEDEGEGAGWREKVVDYCQRLKSASGNGGTDEQSLVLIAESDPADFLAGFLAALLEGWSVALANPLWGTQEWESVGRLIAPDLIWGDQIPLRSTGGQNCSSVFQSTFIAGSKSGLNRPVVLIPTGGSSGQVKFACHSWVSLMTSVDGFLRRFSPSGEAVSTCCVLPVYHVSGLMQVLRAWVSGGQVAVFSFKRLVSAGLLRNGWDGGQLSFYDGWGGGQSLGSAGFGRVAGAHPTRFLGWVVSLVPTQLERLLQDDRGAWLRQFQAVFLGGAPPWPTLLARAAKQQIPLCLSYGMTETAAMVTALMPADFLQGRRSSGQPLSHVTVQILKDNQPVPNGETGQVVVRSGAIAQTSSSHSRLTALYTDDIGYLSADGHLHITGRASSKIISGGENIFPAEVEAALRSTGQVKDVCVMGLPHPHWGEAVTAAYVPATPEVCADSLKQALTIPAPGKSEPLLSRYKCPKYWVPLATLPRNAQGKLNRQRLLSQMAQKIPLSNPPARKSAPDDDASLAESLLPHWAGQY